MEQASARYPEAMGPFRILNVLGGGGMGVVYLGQRQSTGEKVAIKTVRVAKEQHLSGIRREIHALRRLNHPGVVRILEIGVEGSLPWYAMEFLDGGSLAEFIDSLWGRRLGGQSRILASMDLSAESMCDTSDSPIDSPPAFGRAPAAAGAPQVLRPVVAGGQFGRVLAIARRLFSTLAFLHGEGIVHHDLKPANIILRPDDLPVLVDFGLAWRAAGAIGREVLDVSHNLGGTPPYMSPEQIRGDQIDARADLYAAGCILYEMLTGRPPFIGVSAVDFMDQHLMAVPPPPSYFADDASGEIDRLVLSLLDKQPRHRIGRAEDVVHALTQLGARAEPEIGGAPRPYVYRPVLTGREDVLNALSGALSRAHQGEGGVVLIAGESGVGKTCLALEFARSAKDFQIVSGTCALGGTLHQGAGEGFLHPFARLFNLLADRCLAHGPDTTDRLLGPRGKILAAYEPALGRLPGQERYPEPPRVASLAARDRLLSALADTVASLASEQPLLLLLDDLQWADELSLRFLTALPDDWFKGRRLLILGTYRIEDGTALQELSSRPFAKTIHLEPLNANVVRALVADMLALERVPETFIEFLARHSGGNPFFVAEYLRTAVSEGLLERSRHRLADGQEALEFDATVTPTGLPLPLTMRELIERRLAGLTPLARHLAGYAAVIGREFDLDLLRDVAAVTESQAFEAVNELCTRHITEQTEQGMLRFLHDKLFESVYDLLDAGERSRIHGKVAQALERHYEGAAELPRFFSILAHHTQAAGMDDKALQYLERAGDRALERAAYAQACELYREALALEQDRGRSGSGSVENRRRAHWQRGLAEACFNLGDLSACERHATAALLLLGHSLAVTRTGRLTELAKLVGWQAAHRLGLIKRRFTGPEERQDLREAASAAELLAWRSFFVDDSVGVLAMSLLALKQIETASPPLRMASAYARLAYIAGMLRLHGLARSYFASAHAAVREQDDTPSAHFTWLTEATYYVGLARWHEAESINRRALIALRGAGDPQNEVHHLTTLSNLQCYVGRFAESIAGFEQVLHSARARRNLQHMAWGLYASGMGMVAQGRFDEALLRIMEARELLKTLSDGASEMICSGLLALVHLRRGELTLSRSMADETQARIRRSRAVVYSTVTSYIACAEVYLELWEHSLRASDRAAAVDLAGLSSRACADLRNFSLLFPFAGPAVQRYVGQAHAIAGRRLRARLALTRAARRSRWLAMPYDEAQALLLAERYLPVDPGDDRLTRAEALFSQLGCAWHLCQLKRSNGPSQRASAVKSTPPGK